MTLPWLRPLRLPMGMLMVLAGAVLLGPIFWPVDPLEMDFTAFLAAPSLEHPMGTDATGRDVLARFLAGGRLSLYVGTIVMLAGLVPGALLGLVAARAGGLADTILMRVMDSIAAFPPILLAMAVAIGLGGGLWGRRVGRRHLDNPVFRAADAVRGAAHSVLSVH